MKDLNSEKFKFTVTADEAGIPVKKLIRSKFRFSSRLMTKIKRDDLITLTFPKRKAAFQLKTFLSRQSLRMTTYWL